MNPAKRFLRLRFSLRVLLVLFTVAAVLLAIGGRKAYDARKQRQLSSLILAYGGEPHHELNFTDGSERRIRFPSMEFSPKLPGPDWLRRQLGNEYFVEIVEAFFDKASHRVLDDRGLSEFLAEIDSRSLRMPQGLVFSELPITDAGIQQVAQHRHLTSLHIIECPAVTDAALEHLADVHRLRRLRLSGCSISDQGLAHLGGLTDLREVDLSGTSVTDSGLKHLTRLKKLEYLRLTRTQVTREGVKMLDEQLPDCLCSS